MRNNTLRKILSFSLILLLLPVSLFAHSGRTDSRGGHKDNKNASGLGSYHYHCGGYPAHLHSNGVCPYKTKPTTSTSSVSSQPSKSEITSTKFKIGENTISIDGVVENNTTLVELRPLCEALGITLVWDSKTSTATGSSADFSFSIKIGSNTAISNTEEVSLNTPAKLLGGKTLLPARFIAESIGKTVSYNAQTNIIEIN